MFNALKQRFRRKNNRNLGPHKLSRFYNRQIASWMVFFKRETAAIERYQDSIKLHDGDTQAKNCLANLYAHQDASYYQPAKALQLFAELTQEHPKVAEYPFNAGFVEQRLGNHLRAEALFKQAIGLDKHLDRAWYGLALSQIALGQLPAAIESLERNTQLQPMSPYGWYQLSMAQANAGLWAQAAITAKHLHTFEPKFARGLKIDLKALKAAQQTAQQTAQQSPTPEEAVQTALNT
jgi:tetratricopeptide (TPR) repeat protein